MLNTEFYDILDAELTQLVEDNGFRPALKHKTVEQNKPYVFLIWFLRIYGQTYRHLPYITDGKGDSSCDIILDIEDVVHGKMYYVAQSKWNNKRNCIKKIDSQEFKATLDNFQLVFEGEKGETGNERFNEKYKELQQHVSQNGLVRFVYLALCESNPEIADNIAAFEKNHSTKIKILDINRLKLDYIDRHYKQIAPDSPLEIKHSPIKKKMQLPIEQLNIKQNFLRVERPFLMYVLLLRPKTIFDLFNKYKFRLFFKNVRNPLMDSKVNENIEATLEKEMPFFTYFNNGITAITNSVDQHINPTAELINVFGFQVINGTQTVYSIYKNYRDNPGRRDLIDKEVLVTLRLIVINSDELSLKITRFTNSQNPLEERDFWANDAIQIQLQNESFETKYWYEKRREEFRVVPDDVTVVSSRDLAFSHLALNLARPRAAWEAIASGGDYLFVSSEDDRKNGLYQQTFINAQFKDMLAAYLFGETVYPHIYPDEELSKNELIHELLLVRIVLDKYLKRKLNTHELNLNKYILKNHENEKLLFAKIAKFTTELISRMLGNDIITKFDFTKNTPEFWDIKTRFESLDISKELAEKIENTELDS